MALQTDPVATGYGDATYHLVAAISHDVLGNLTRLTVYSYGSGDQAQVANAQPFKVTHYEVSPSLVAAADQTGAAEAWLQTNTADYPNPITAAAVDVASGKVTAAQLGASAPATVA